MNELLSINNLKIILEQEDKSIKTLVYPLSININKGEVVGVVGESGSGKSLIMKSLINILPDKINATYHNFIFNGLPVHNSNKLPISMIFQDPMTSLNPVRSIGYHLIEVVNRNQKLSKKQATKIAIQELDKVGIDSPERRLKQFPHELSGGMRQRVMIAMALLSNPKLLIADEPTTALDVTIQAQILALIKRLQIEEGLSVLLVTHDFGVVAGMCDYIKVMYRGYLVEEGTTSEIFNSAKHPYTQQLLSASDLAQKHIIDFSLRVNEPNQHKQQKTVLSGTHSVWFEGVTQNVL